MAKEVSFESEGRLSRREDAFVADLKGEVADLKGEAESEILLAFDGDLRSTLEAESAMALFFLLVDTLEAKNFLIIS